MTITSREKREVPGHEISGSTHVVQFSENDVALVRAVGAFLGAALRQGDACIIVATQTHQASLSQFLQASGLDIAGAEQAGSYISLDAAETLAQFMVEGEPDPARFHEVIGSIIAGAAPGQRRVSIFGEMVALLWSEGRQTAALRLEELWNELSQKHVFSLFCAYPMQVFSGKEHEAGFGQVCHQHSQIVPPESYLQLSEDERLRAFALLQQKAHTLEVEVEERKAVQERLRVMAAIVESTDDAVLSKDLEGIITSWNPAAERMYGYTAEEIIGHSVTRIFPPHQQEEFEQIMERIRRGEQVEHHETRRMRKDGTIFMVSVTISPLRNESGAIIGASSIARDITERRHLEARSQQLFASNLVGIFVAGGAGALLEVNQAFLDLVGYTREEWQAGAIKCATANSSETLFQHPLIPAAIQQTGYAEPQETLLRRKEGQPLPVLVAVTGIEHTDTCIGFVLDISERKALEERKDAFIGMASHELKTPLTSLKGFLSLTQRLLSTLDDETIQHCLVRMDAQIDKLTQLINDLLDVSRMQNGQLVYRLERFELDALVQEVVESMQEATQTHQIQLVGQTHIELAGDRDRLGQVITNLLNNAIKYSPRADTVVVRLASDKAQALVSVQDFGYGIAREHHRKIFERFYQVTDAEGPVYSGLGIGLAISNDIAKRHGGRLWVESQKGAGATFYLSLPLSREESTLIEQQ